jgi:Flp pilus assembly protein TadG
VNRHFAFRSWKSARGQGLVETAFVLITLLLFTFAVIDFALVFYVYQSLENGISQATRYATTGQRKQVIDPVTGLPVTLNRVDSVKKAMQDSTVVDLSAARYTFTNISNPSGDPAGGPGDIVKVQVALDWPICTPLISPLFPGGKVTLTAASAVKNEPFPN